MPAIAVGAGVLKKLNRKFKYGHFKFPETRPKSFFKKRLILKPNSNFAL